MPNELMDEFRQRLLPFVVADDYSIKNEEGICQYTVRSIYLDTRNINCYTQKSDGVELRRKFRIRGYNTMDADSKVILEIKRKIGSRIRKHRSVLLYSNLIELMKNPDLEKYIIQGSRKQEAIDDARRFFYHLKKNQLTPANLVVYEREAYQGKIDKGVRITFDKNIRAKLYPKLEQLYDCHDLKPLFNNHFVVEIKYYTDEMPIWTRSLVQEYKLRCDAISKYTIGYDVNKFNQKLTY